MPRRCSTSPARPRRPASKAQALNRQALGRDAQSGSQSGGRDGATAALKSARQSKQSPIDRDEPVSSRRSAVPRKARRPGRQNAMRGGGAVSQARRSRRPGSRALGLSACIAVTRVAPPKGTGRRARRLALCRRCGDLYGAGNALNMLMFHEADLAAALKLLHARARRFRSRRLRRAAGDDDQQPGHHVCGARVVPARPPALPERRSEIYRRVGVVDSFARKCRHPLTEAEIADGAPGRGSSLYRRIERDGARGAKPVASMRWSRAPQGRLALLEGDAADALECISRRNSASVLRTRSRRDAKSTARRAGRRGVTSRWGSARAALTATRRATEMHRRTTWRPIDGMWPATSWWRHSQALRANKKPDAAREALERAYGFMLQGIAGLSDEGLRRNYLNKNESASRDHRRLARRCAQAAALSGSDAAAHLAGEASLREPFERLVDTGLRLNELRSVEELHEFLIDEATELSGAERVLLVLEAPRRAATRGLARPARRGCGRRCSREVTASLRGSAAHAHSEPRLQPDGATRARAALAHHRAADRAAAAPGLPLCRSSTARSGASAKRIAISWDAREPGRRRARQRAVVAGSRAESRRAHRSAQRVEREARAARQRARDHQRSAVGARGAARHSRPFSISSATSCATRSMRRSVSIYTYDRQTNLMHFRYDHRKGGEAVRRAHPLRGFGAKVIGTRQPLMINENMAARSAEAGSTIVGGGEAPKSGIWVPTHRRRRSARRDLDPEHRSRKRFHRFRFPPAEHARRQHERRARERAPLRRDAAPASRKPSSAPPSSQSSTASRRGWRRSSTSRRSSISSATSCARCSSTGDIGIRLVRREDRTCIHYLYEFEHGERLTMPPTRAQPGSVPAADASDAPTDRVDTSPTEGDWRIRIQPFPAPKVAKAIVDVPIVGSDRVHRRRSWSENYEREDAFGEVEHPPAARTVAATHGRRAARTRASSTRRSGCSRKPSSAPPSSRSSTASRKGSRPKLDIQAIVRPGRRQDARSIRRGRSSGSACTTRRPNLVHYRVSCYDHGERLPSGTGNAARIHRATFFETAQAHRHPHRRGARSADGGARMRRTSAATRIGQLVQSTSRSCSGDRRSAASIGVGNASASTRSANRTCVC